MITGTTLTELAPVEANALQREQKRNGKDFASPSEAFGEIALKVWAIDRGTEYNRKEWAKNVDTFYYGSTEEQVEIYKDCERNLVKLAAAAIEAAALCQKAIASPCMEDFWKMEGGEK